VNKNNKKIYISIAGLIVIILAAIFFVQSNTKANNSDNSGGVGTYNPAATSTPGYAHSLTVGDVDERDAYARIQSGWIWTKTTYKNPKLAPTGPTKGKDFVLTFNRDKTVSIAGDCNSFQGTYSIDKNTVSGLETIDEMALGAIKISPLVGTEKACAMSKERGFTTDLSKVTSYDLRSLQLHLMLPNDEETITFTRKAELEGVTVVK
jgi:heat shock protein HslJ